MAAAPDPRQLRKQQEASSPTVTPSQEYEQSYSNPAGSQLPPLVGDIQNVTSVGAPPQPEPDEPQARHGGHDLADQLARMQQVLPEFQKPLPPVSQTQPVANPTPAYMPPDQAMYQPDHPDYAGDIPLMRRLDSVAAIGRQLTGQLIKPDVAWDLARSGIPLDQIAGVLRLMMANTATSPAAPIPHRVDKMMVPNNIDTNDEEFLPFLQQEGNTQELARINEINRNAEKTREHELNNFQNGIIPYGMQGTTPGVKTWNGYDEDYLYPKGSATVFMGPADWMAQQILDHSDAIGDKLGQFMQGAGNEIKNQVESNPIVMVAAGASQLWSWLLSDKEQNNKPVVSATDPEMKDWQPIVGPYGPTQWVKNRVTGEVKSVMDPAFQSPLAGANVPNTTQQDSGIKGTPNDLPAHTVTDLRNNLHDFGFDVDYSSPTLTAKEVTEWRTFYDHQGGQDVQTQLQMQDMGFGKNLPITGFFSQTNGDGTPNETGQKWWAAYQDYQRYRQHLDQYIQQHPEDAVMLKEVGFGPLFVALKNGDWDWFARELNKQKEDIGQTTVTGGIPVLSQAEITLRGALAIASNLGQLSMAPFDAVTLGDHIHHDTEFNSVAKRAYESGSIDKDLYDRLTDNNMDQGYLVAIASIKDPQLRDQLRSLALKTMADYGMAPSATVSGVGTFQTPEPVQPKVLGGLAEWLASASLKDNTPEKKQILDWIEQHPIAADLANVALTWKVVPFKGGINTRTAVPVPGAYARASRWLGGVTPYTTTQIEKAYRTGTDIDEHQLARVMTSGAALPHMVESESFRPAQQVVQAVRDAHGAGQDLRIGAQDPKELPAIIAALRREGLKPTVRESDVQVKVQLPTEYDKLQEIRNGFKDRMNVSSVDGTPLGNIDYTGRVLAKGEIRKIVSDTLDRLNVEVPGLLTTRMAMPVRLNLMIEGMMHDNVGAPLFRLLGNRAYHGLLNFASPEVVDQVRTIANQYVHDSVARKQIIEGALNAYRQGPKGYALGEDVVHRLFSHIEQNYNLPKTAQMREAVQRGRADGFSMPTADGGFVERSIYNTEHEYQTYFPSMAEAVKKSEAPAFLRNPEWAGSQRIQDAWNTIDQLSRQGLMKSSRALNFATTWAIRKPATLFSLPFQSKVYTRYIWVKMTEGINDDGWKGRFQKVLDRNPGAWRLKKVVVPRQFAHDARAYWGGTNVDEALANALGRRFNSDQGRMLADVYSTPLKDLLGEQEYAAMGAQLDASIENLEAHIAHLKSIPEGGIDHLNARLDLPDQEKQLYRLNASRDYWRRNEVTPLNGGEDAIRARLNAWLETPAGQFFKAQNEAATGSRWDEAINAHYINSATKHLSDIWWDYPNLTRAVTGGERDGDKLYQIGKRHNELIDKRHPQSNEYWVPIHTIEDPESAWGAIKREVGDKADRFSYFALKDVKLRTFDDLSANYYGRLAPAVEAGRLGEEEAATLAITKARDMTNDLMFDLLSSMTQLEMRARFLAPFATKRRLFWQHVAGKAITDNRVQIALGEAGSAIQQMNAGQNEFNKDKISFTFPVGIGGWSKGTTVDFHLFNQLWLGQHDELENYALLNFAGNAIGVTHPDPNQQYAGVFGYYPSAYAPQSTLFPRFGDWAIWLRAAMQAEGKWPGNPMTIDEIYNQMPPALVAQHQAMANALQAQHSREDGELHPADASRAAFLDLLFHSTAKIGFPFAPGISPVEREQARQEVSQYWNAKSKQEIDALMEKYPALASELHLAQDPTAFKDWMDANVQYGQIQAQFTTDMNILNTKYPLSALLTDKNAKEDMAKAKQLRDDRLAQLAQDHPLWGEQHGYVYRDKDGKFKSNDEVKRLLAQRGSPFEIDKTQLDEHGNLKNETSGGLYQQAKMMFTNFTDANNIVPIDQAGHDQLLNVLNTYKSLDQAIAKFEAMPDSDEKDKALAALHKQRNQFYSDWQDILDAYWPKGNKTQLELARDLWYQKVYTPWQASLQPLYDSLDPKQYPYLSSKDKATIEDKLTVTKDQFNHPYQLPEFPGVTFPAPEQVNWLNKQPDTQAVNLAKWQVIATHHPEWLTQWQRSLLTDRQQLIQALQGWDQGTYNLYLATLKSEIANESKFSARGFARGFGGGGATRQEIWRAYIRKAGREPNIFAPGVNVPVTHESGNQPVNQTPQNIFAAVK